MFARLFAVFALVGGVFGLAAGCSGGVVGGDCRPGYGPCGDTCVDLQRSVDNCGLCGNVCGDGFECVAGECRAEGPDSGSGGTSGSGGRNGSGGRDIDGSAGDSSADGGDGSVEGGTGGRNGTGGRGSTGGTGSVYPDGGDPNISPDGSVCLGPYDNPQNCGRCGNVCPPDKPLCALNESWICVPRCEAPLIDCGGRCVNTDTDPNNCGRCGNRCESQICQGGECIGATAGHQILMCTDFRQRPPAGTAYEKVIGNAVFLAANTAVKVLAYEEFAPAAIVNSVKQTLRSAAGARGRPEPVYTDVFTSSDVTNNLDVTKFDVFLVFDQQLAPSGRLAVAGNAWAPSLDQFVRAGGIAIVLAGPTGRGEMDNLLTTANLLPTFGQFLITNEQIYNRFPGDAIGLNVVSPMLAYPETCTFDTDAPDQQSTFVITDTPASDGDLGKPIVVHRVITP